MKEGIFISGEALKEALQFADVKGSFRTGLQGLHINVENPQKPILEATDGHRLHRLEHDNSSYVFPETDGIVSPSTDKQHFTLSLSDNEKDDLIFKLREAQALAKIHRSGGHVGIRMKFTKTRIILLMDNYILVRYIKPDSSIPPELAGSVVGVNIRYFIEGLNCFKHQGISITLVDALSPVLIKPSDSDYPIHVLMPMHMESMKKRRNK